MIEEITIVSKSDLIVAAKSKKTYFTITDQNDRKLICFKPHMHDQLPLGEIIPLNIQPGRTADDTPRIEGLAGEESPQSVATPSVKPPQIVSGEEKGMWWKEIGELIRFGKLEEVFGEKDAQIIKRAYKLQAIASLGITAKKED